MAPHPHPNAIADCVLNAFYALPQKFKPRTLADGRREWVPLAGVVLSRHRRSGTSETPVSKQDGTDVETGAARGEDDLRCVSLATGMKCLPRSKIASAKGRVLHDSHAEVLAIRGFNRWLVDECADLAANGYGTGRETHNDWVKWRRQPASSQNAPPFQLQDNISIHMYCSQAPCGDASMELTMREQADATPWPTPSSTSTGDSLLPGRGHFDQLGIVRRKPSRPDAPVTWSKSCSDKLALKQCTGLLSALTARLVGKEGTWLSSLVLPKEEIVPEAVERCFGRTGRLAPVLAEEVQERWKGLGYEFRPFEVLGTEREFEFSKCGTLAPASNLSALSIACPLSAARGEHEVLINGVLQGRRQDDPRGASCISRSRMWEAVRNVYALMGRPEDSDEETTYGEVKEGSGCLEGRETVKSDVRWLALKAWRRNTGDEGWTLEG